MGIWDIHKWNVLPDKLNEHEDVMKEYMVLLKQLMPTIQAHYFHPRFGAVNARVLVLSSFESLAEWENLLGELREHPDYRKLVGRWFACWDLSSHDEYFWDEADVKVMTKLATSS
jgi:hypothetical protein